MLVLKRSIRDGCVVLFLPHNRGIQLCSGRWRGAGYTSDEWDLSAFSNLNYNLVNRYAL